MKLTYFITSLNFGGAEIGMARLLSAIEESERGAEFDITVISLVETPRDVVELLPETVDVIHLDVGNPLKIWKLRPLWKELHDTDVLVCSLYHASVVGVLLGSLRQVPQILTWQHSPEYRSSVAKSLYGMAHGRSDKILADSDFVKQMLVNEFGITAGKISIVPIAGVDTEKFAPTRNPVSFANDDAVQIGTVGRLEHPKGYDYLLECADTIEGAHFHIVGDGSLIQDLQNLAEEYQLNNVTFHGKIPVDEIPNYLNSFDIYFQPSRHEGLCMTVIEASAVGLPIVASKVGGITESVVEGETGYLVEPGNIDRYTEALERLIESSELRDRFGRAGRERVISRYSKQNLNDVFYEIVTSELA